MHLPPCSPRPTHPKHQVKIIVTFPLVSCSWLLGKVALRLSPLTLCLSFSFETVGLVLGLLPGRYVHTLMTFTQPTRIKSRVRVLPSSFHCCIIMVYQYEKTHVASHLGSSFTFALNVFFFQTCPFRAWSAAWNDKHTASERDVWECHQIVWNPIFHVFPIHVHCPLPTT